MRLVAELRAENVRLSAYAKEQEERLAEALDTIKLLKRRLYSASRERYIADPLGQQCLFDTVELGGGPPPEAGDLFDTVELGGGPPPEAADQGNDAHEPAAEKRKPARKRHQRLIISETLPCQTIEHKLTGEALRCPCCGDDREAFRKHVSRQLEIEPARVYVREDRSYSYSCRSCRVASPVVASRKPPSALSKGIFGPSVAALVTELKFARHLPLYRQQEMLMGPLRQWVSRPHLCHLLRRTAEGVRPLTDLMLCRILSSHLIHIDETTIKMLVRKKRKAALAYLWGYHGGIDQPYVYFDFRPGRGRDGPAEILGDYRGFILTDGYDVYSSLARNSLGRIILACCWAHVRRGFFEANEVTANPLIGNILTLIQKLYDLEDKARDWSPEARLELRQKESAPLVAQIKVYLDQAMPGLRPASKLCQAAQYTLNRWEELNVFLRDGRIPMDNTLLERSFKAIATGRKNYLFLGGETAGPTAAILYTLVRNAANHNLDIHPYLRDVIEKVPVLMAEGKPLDELLPDQWALANPDKVLLNRDHENRQAQERKNKKRMARRTATA